LFLSSPDQGDCEVLGHRIGARPVLLAGGRNTGRFSERDGVDPGGPSGPREHATTSIASVAHRTYLKWSKKKSSDFSISTAEEVWRGCNFTGERE